MMEDMIDFPCSDDWLDYYHEQGLTPRRSGRTDPTVKELLREIAELRKMQMEMQEILLEVVKGLSELMGEKTSKYTHTQKRQYRDLERLKE